MSPWCIPIYKYNRDTNIYKCISDKSKRDIGYQLINNSLIDDETQLNITYQYLFNIVELHSR